MQGFPPTTSCKQSRFCLVCDGLALIYCRATQEFQIHIQLTMSFLALDVGNTRLKWALFDSPKPRATLIDQGAVFLENIDRLGDNEWRQLSAPSQMLGCIVAGEAIRRRVEEQLELWDFTPHWAVSSTTEAGVTNGYDHPTRLGADRWVAMIGAHARMHSQTRQQPPRPMVVVMVGTAVTVDAIDADGRFLGGLILPGFGLMYRALESGTAGLKASMIISRGVAAAPDERAVGRLLALRAMTGSSTLN